MPFGLGEAAEGGARAAARGALGRWLGNPLVAALAATAAVLTIVFAVLGSSLRRAPWRSRIRAALYAYAAVAALLAVHYYALRWRMEARVGSSERAQLANVVNEAHAMSAAQRGQEGFVPVAPGGAYAPAFGGGQQASAFSGQQQQAPAFNGGQQQAPTFNGGQQQAPMFNGQQQAPAFNGGQPQFSGGQAPMFGGQQSAQPASSASQLLRVL